MFTLVGMTRHDKYIILMLLECKVCKVIFILNRLSFHYKILLL